jgi:hypothetical protein
MCRRWRGLLGPELLPLGNQGRLSACGTLSLFEVYSYSGAGNASLRCATSVCFEVGLYLSVAVMGRRSARSSLLLYWEI